MSHAAFENVMNNVFYWITWVFEIIGAVVIITGAVISTIKYVTNLVKNKRAPLKIMLANQLALGLEFMLAAEILKTVMTTNRSREELIMLGAIVLLRAALSGLIHWEIRSSNKLEREEKKLLDNEKDNV